MNRVTFNSEELTFLYANRSLVKLDLHAAFVRNFKRPEVTERHIRRLFSRRHWRRDYNCTYTTEELAYLKANCHLLRRDLHKAFVEKFNRPDVTVQDVRNRCGARGWVAGRRSKAAPGTTRINDKGDLIIRGDAPKDWRLMKRVIWEEMFGPISKDRKLVPLNGDRLDFDLLNWVVVSNGMVTRLQRSGFFEAPPELKPTIFALERLKHETHHVKSKRQQRE